MLNPVEEKPGLKIWPGGRHKPCAFLDVAHAEKDVLVAGGSLESLENTKEASIAVSIEDIHWNWFQLSIYRVVWCVSSCSGSKLLLQI